jgi:hypothetical protein
MSSADLVVLRAVEEDVIGTTPTSMKAAGRLKATANLSNGDTVTIGAKVYTMQTTLTNVDGNVKIGATLLDSLTNIYNAMGLTGVAGTDYAAAMVAHTTVDPVALVVDTLFVKAKTAGTAGNALATTETSANASWGAATLTGGQVGPNLQQLRFTGEGLNFNIQNITSDEITPTRTQSDLIQVGASGAGDLNVELSYDSYNDLLAAALCSYWRPGTGDTSLLQNGTYRRTFSVQKDFSDMVPRVFHLFRGTLVEGLTLKMEIGKIVSGAFNLLSFGIDPATGITAVQLTNATFAAVSSTTPLNAVANLQNFVIDGTPYAGCISTLSMQIKNNARAIQCLGSITARDMKLGQFEITGDMELYFNEGSNFGNFVAGTEFDFAFELVDAAGNKYTFSFERCKFETGEVVAGGKNTDVMFKAKYRGLYDAATGRVFQLTADPA